MPSIDGIIKNKIIVVDQKSLNNIELKNIHILIIINIKIK